MNCIDDAIKIWREVLMDITHLPNEKILNGESLRGPELAVVKDGQKIPIGLDDPVIVFYCDPIEDISVVDGSDTQTVQSYELHLIVYGNQCKKMAQKIKSNIYSEEVLNILRENGIGLLSIPSITNASNFMVSQSYILRNDIRIRFDCRFEDQKMIDIGDIEEGQIGTKNA